jgi:hypothetical protein
MVGAELGKTASETFPRDSLDFNAFTSAFKTLEPIRNSGRCQPLASFGRSMSGSTGAEAVLDPPAYGATGGVNGKPEQPCPVRRSAGAEQYDVRARQCDTLNGSADPELSLTAKRTAEHVSPGNSEESPCRHLGYRDGGIRVRRAPSQQAPVAGACAPLLCRSGPGIIAVADDDDPIRASPSTR